MNEFELKKAVYKVSVKVCDKRYQRGIHKFNNVEDVSEEVTRFIEIRSAIRAQELEMDEIKLKEKKENSIKNRVMGAIGWK